MLTKEEREQISQDISNFISKKYGDRFLQPKGGFLVVLIEENSDMTVDNEYFTNYRVKDCPHCYNIIKMVHEIGLESLSVITNQN